MKRLTAYILVAAMVLSLIPTTVWAEEKADDTVLSQTGETLVMESEENSASEERTQEETEPQEEEKLQPSKELPEESEDELVMHCFSGEDLGVTDEELFAAYVQREFDEALGIEAPAMWSTSVLKEGTLEREIYEALKRELAAIADGEGADGNGRINTQLYLSEFTKSWSAEDLGVTNLKSGGRLSAGASSAILEMLKRIYYCLLADCPLELYWHDKVYKIVTMGGEETEVGGVRLGYIGESYDANGDFQPGVVAFYFSVAKDYSATGTKGTFVADAEKTGATSEAVENAQEIVAKYSDLDSDVEKLKAYNDEISARVDYNRTAVQNSKTPYGDPWQMIYVFDDSTATKVVCEGYAKAFQYLCDLSEFSSDAIQCHTVYGEAIYGRSGGLHMWNVVTLDDGRNYLVDVTNSDNTSSTGSSMGKNDEMFLLPAKNASADHRSHYFTVSGEKRTFTYDTVIADLFEGYPALSPIPYGEELEELSLALSGEKRVVIGDTVTLTLNMTGMGVFGMETTLSFDGNVLEYVSSEALLEEWEQEYHEGKLVLYSVDEPIYHAADALTVTFRVKSGAEVGTPLSVEFSQMEITEDGVPVELENALIWKGVAIDTPVVQWGMMEGEELPSVWEKGSMDEAMAYANGRAIGEVAYVQLINDVKTTAPLVFEDGRTTVLDLNGYDIDRGLTEATVEGSVLGVTGNLTLCDTSSDDVTKQGRITGGYNSWGAGAWVAEDALLTIEGGNITGNKVTHAGGGLYVWGTVVMNGGTISDNTAGEIGGGAFFGGPFVMNGGVIAENTAEIFGGGIFSLCSTVNMNGGTIAGNTVAQYGGGVCIDDGMLIMDGGAISKNTAVYGGGGVYVRNGSFTMNEGVISANINEGFGGGVCVDDGGTFMMGGGSISDNSADSGGGVCIDNGAFTMDEGTISKNVATNHGGGVNICEEASFSMDGGSILGNTAGRGAGGVMVCGGCTFTMSGGDVTKNTAKANSGVCVEGTLQLYGTPNISNNTYGKGSAAKSSNVCINPDGAVYLMDALGESAAIGVTTMATPMGDAPVMVALGGGDPAHIPTADDAAKFTSDEGHVVQLASHEGGAAIVLMPVPVATLGKTSGSLNLFEDAILTIPVECNYPILSAQFVNEDLDEVFNLAVTEDGVQITSKGDKPEHVTWSAWGKELAGTYKSAIDIEYSDGSYCTTAQTLSIKLTAAAPKVTAAALKFNSFYLNETQQLIFSTKEGVVSEVFVDKSKATNTAPACPAWITLNDDGTVTLDNSKLVNNKGSGKLNLEVWLEGYRAPVQVAVSVSVAYTAPKLKLSATSLSLSNNTVPEGVPMTLLSADKKFSLADLNVTSLRAANDDDLAAMSEKDRKTYAGSTAIGIVDFDSVTGAFNLTVNGRLINGKVMLIATIGDNSEQEVNISLTIKVIDRATLKASATKITLNTAMGTGEIHDEKIVTFSTNAQGFWFGAADWSSITDASGHDCSAELDIPFLQTTRADFALSFRANEKTVEGKTYKVTVYVEGTAKPVVINVTAKALVPTVKLSTKSLSLHQNNGIGTITVSGVKGYDVSDLVVDAPSAVSVGGDSEAITFELTNRAELGKTYRVNISYELACGLRTKPVAISVKAVDKITATASVKGNMDVTRPDTTSSNFTFKYTGWYPSKDFSHDPVLEWKVYAKNGKNPIDSSDYPIDPVKGSLVSYGSIDNVSKSEGWFENVSTEPYGVKLAINAYGDRAWNDGEINPKYTYNVYFTLTFHNDIGTTEDDIIVELKPVKMTVKQGSVKFAASTNIVTLSKTADAVSDAFTIYSTDKDKEYVAGIAKVDFVRSTLADGLVLDYQWNEETMGYDCTLAWAEGIPVTAKSGTVKLNIYLTGSTGVKPNATVSLKVNMK